MFSTTVLTAVRTIADMFRSFAVFFFFFFNSIVVIVLATHLYTHKPRQLLWIYWLQLVFLFSDILRNSFVEKVES